VPGAWSCDSLRKLLVPGLAIALSARMCAKTPPTKPRISASPPGAASSGAPSRQSETLRCMPEPGL
jgi:hypothetical protein